MINYLESDLRAYLDEAALILKKIKEYILEGNQLFLSFNPLILEQRGARWLVDHRIEVLKAYRKTLIPTGDVDPVPDSLFRYKMDGNDPSLASIDSSRFVVGKDLPDLIATTFDGTDQRIASSDSSLLNIGSSPVSIAVRIKATTAAQNKTILSYGTGSSINTFRLRVASSGFLQLRTNSTNRAAANSSLFNDDQWHHIVVTMESGGDIKFYVDGVFNNGSTSATYNYDGTQNLVVGSTNNTQYFDGIIDDIRFYTRILTPEEILSLANNESNLPNAPVLEPLTVLSDSEIIANWDAQIVDFYTVEFDTINTFDSPNFTTENTTNTTLTKTGLTQKTEYFVRVKAVNAGGESPYSNIENATTESLPFTFTVKSDNSGISNNNEFSLAFSGTYTGDINWGDGNIDSYTNETSPILHTFNSGVGLYQISVVNSITPVFNNTNDGNKLTLVSNWGTCILSDNAFLNLSNFTGWTSTDAPEIFNLEDLFSGTNSIVFTNNISTWDTSNATSMLRTFANDINWLGIESWNTVNVTSMQDMARFNNSFDVNISGWNVSNVLTFRRMLQGCTSFNQNLGSWNLSAATDLRNMLDNCGMSTENYNLTLHGWVNGGWTIPSGLTLGAASLVVDTTSGGVNGITARDTLINVYNWTINDATPISSLITDPDAIAYINTSFAGAIISTSNQLRIQTLITTLKSDGNWNNLDYLLLLDQGAQGLTDIKGLVSATLNGGVIDEGDSMKGNGVDGYIDTNFAPSTDGVNYQLNNVFISSVQRDSTNGVYFYARNSNNRCFISSASDGSVFNTLINNNSLANRTFGSTATVNVPISSKSNGTVQKLYENGIEAGSNNVSPISIPTSNFEIFRTPSIQSLSETRLSYVAIGGNTVNEVSFNTAIKNYLGL